MSSFIKKQSTIHQAFLLLVFSLNLMFSVQAEEIITEPIRTFEGHTERVSSVAFSPNEETVLSGAGYIDNTMKLWNLSTGEVIRTFEGHSHSIYSVAYSPDGQMALSGSRDNTMKLWNLSTGELIRTFEGHSDFVISVAYSPDGQTALSGSYDKTMKLWNLSTGELMRTFEGHSHWVESVAYSPDGQTALSGSRDDTMKLWNLTTEEVIRTFEGQSSGIMSVAYSPDGQMALSGSIDDTMKLWNLSTGKLIRIFKGHSRVAYSPDGQTALSGGYNDDTEKGEIKLWNLSTGEVIRTFQEHSNNTVMSVLSVAYSPDGKRALSGGWNKTINLWDLGLETTDETDETTVGQAIVIAASGSQPSNTLFKYSNDFAQRIYRLLKQRGFSDKSIHYMSPLAPDIEPFDGRLETERQDYQLFDAEQEISDAFAQAAANLKAGQQFVFYLHGHAWADRISLMPDYELTATRLRALLDTLPTDVQQIIVLDTCFSGSFMDDLAGENRIIISSTDDSSKAFQVAYASFADSLIKQLYRGSSITESFQIAEDSVLNAPRIFREQIPWLDDDGDGKYISDGARASKVFLGGEGISAATPPSINHVHPYITLDKETSSATLWVETTPKQEGIRQVRAVLINPNFTGTDYQGEETDFGREEIILIYNPAQERHEIAYDGFCTEGIWQIQYQAQNTKGMWSEIVKGEVEAQNCSIVTTKMLLNQSRYTTNDPIRLDMEVNGNTNVDLYAAIVFPSGIFMTIAYPLNFSWPNAIQVYQPNVNIVGKKTYSIMDFPVPANIELGPYQACGVLVGAGNDPDQSNWLHIHCADFEVY